MTVEPRHDAPVALTPAQEAKEDRKLAEARAMGLLADDLDSPPDLSR